MLNKFNKTHQILLKIFFVQGAIFGFLPLKFDKRLNRFVSSKSIHFFNLFLIIIFIINFIALAFHTFEIILKHFDNTKRTVSVVYQLVFFFFTIYSYIFMYQHQKKIVNILNQFIQLCSLLIENENDVKIFSKFLILLCFFLQPLLFAFDIFFLYLSLKSDFYGNLLNTLCLFFVVPTRLISIFVCLILNFHSMLLQKALNTQVNVKIFAVLNLTETIVELFNPYVCVYMICHYFTILTYTFGLFTFAIATVLRTYPFSTAVLAVLIYLVHFLIEILNVEMMNRKCKDVNRQVFL
jgi:hypothetical protein